MAEFFDALTDDHVRFIGEQHVFFVATAAAEGRVNLSPKGLDSLRVLAPDAVAWLNLTGSGNETAAHLLENPRMTLMFCSFDRAPLILRLYGRARVTHAGEPGWPREIERFGPRPGARQVYALAIESVQTSCGFAVPRYEPLGERDTLTRWAEKRGEEGIREYWRERNVTSIDGRPTGMAAHVGGDASAGDADGGAGGAADVREGR